MIRNMQENKICPNCGTNNNSISNFCTNCGEYLVGNSTNTNNQNSMQMNMNNKETEGNKFGTISLILYFSGPFITLLTSILPHNLANFISSLSGLLPLSGIIVMIMGRVKFPTNKFLKVVMWIIIGTIILGVIAMLLFMIWCYATCTGMDTSGCN